jgi:serine/threonine protein kinase
LKPANIFVDEDINVVLGMIEPLNISLLYFVTSFFIYVGDFGESRFFIPSENAGTVSALGTMLYMSPEMVRNEKFDKIFVVLLRLLLVEIHFLQIFGHLV